MSKVTSLTHPRPAGTTRSVTSVRRWIVVALLGVLLVTAWKVHTWWGSPERRIAQFMSAARRGDAAAILALASAEEVQRLGLTPSKLQAMLTDASGVPGGPVLVNPHPQPFGGPQLRYNRGVSVNLAGRDGTLLRSGSGGRLGAVVIAYNTDDGWKIAIGRHIRTMLASRSRANALRGSYAAFCERHGLPAEHYSPESGRWVPVRRPR